jgi:hypothetical protein
MSGSVADVRIVSEVPPKAAGIACASEVVRPVPAPEHVVG